MRAAKKMARWRRNNPARQREIAVRSRQKNLSATHARDRAYGRKRMAATKADPIAYAAYLADMRARFAEWKARNPEHGRQYVDAVKREALAAYGGVGCGCCGETELRFLTLDHMRGDGWRHRAELGSRTLGGGTLYRKLRSLGWPQDLGLAVRCYNCNLGRSYNGVDGACPHIAMRWRYSAGPRHHFKLKVAVIQHYSGGSMQCHCCGESNLGFLSLDHMRNDGKRRRNEVGKGGEYYDLRRRGYPDNLGIAVACFNCNSGRAGNGGRCPHVDKVSRVA
jgi:hypothetical protein